MQLSQVLSSESRGNLLGAKRAIINGKVEPLRRARSKALRNIEGLRLSIEEHQRVGEKERAEFLANPSPTLFKSYTEHLSKAQRDRRALRQAQRAYNRAQAKIEKIRA